MWHVRINLFSSGGSFSSSCGSFSSTCKARFFPFLGWCWLPAPPCTAGTVETSPKNSDDSENDLCKFRLGGGWKVTCFHVDLGAVLEEYKLEQIKCEAAKTVSVGNTHES